MPEPRMNVIAAVDALARRRDQQVVIPTMTVMPVWARRAGATRDLPAHGFMGGASTLGLGIQLARPDVPVWVLDGDGSLAMQLGSLLTIADARPRRFLHVVLHNGVYATSGGQPLVGEGRVSFAELARGAGYAAARCFRDVSEFDAELDELLRTPGPVLLELICDPLRDPVVATNVNDSELKRRLRRLAGRARRALLSRKRRADAWSLDLAQNWRRVHRSLAGGPSIRPG
jgi:phosphonopyruvate decarboxylase